MDIVFAVSSGILLALVSNYLLDYLVVSRGLVHQKTRLFKIIGLKHEGNMLAMSTHLNPEKVFTPAQFPICYACMEKMTCLRFFFGQKCVNCGATPRTRFWVLLVGLPIIFGWLTLNPITGFRIGDIYLLIVFYAMVFIMDMEHRVILYPLTIAGILFGAYFGISYHGILSTLAGGLAGGAIMLLFYWLGILYIRYLRKTSKPKINEVALGFGDVSLSFILGLILGWPGILGGLFFGIVLGGFFSGAFLLIKISKKQYAPNDLILPYAPFLIIGALLIMLL